MVDEYFEHYEVSPETFKKMQNKMLEMLLYFRDFCREHQLMFYLCGGGAIGAVREKGFVPWDDDIDCFMPRKDYEKFQELWERYGDKSRFVFCRSNDKVNFHHSCTSLRDPSTTFICSYNTNLDICHGVALEIAPIDGCPNSRIKRYIQLFQAFIFALFNTQRLPNNKGRVFRIVASVVYKLVPSKKVRYKIWKWAEKQMSKYSWDECENVTELIGSVKGMLYVHPKEWFASQVWMEFEGHEVPLMAGYHEYLTRIFGDYMKRPPIEQQVAKHELEFVDMDHPYTFYKNVKYFPNKKEVKKMNVAVIFAGGTGQRMNTKTRPKQFLELHGKPILIYTIEEFQSHPEIDGIILVVLSDWISHCQELVKKYRLSKVKDIVAGGETALDSQKRGVERAMQLYDEDTIVLIHDGVRPLIDEATISKNIESVKEHGTAITVTPAIETITIVTAEHDVVGKIIERAKVQMAKAPQSFRLGELWRGHHKAENDNLEFIDSASMMQHYGFKLYTVQGKPENIKITTPNDFYTFRALVDARENSQIFGL